MATKLSPKNGLNSFIHICFWCGKPKNMTATPGKLPGDKKVESKIVDIEPCDECDKKFRNVMNNGGIIVFEVDTKENVEERAALGPIQDDMYLTGRAVGITEEIFNQVMPPTDEQSEEGETYNATLDEIKAKHKVILDAEAFEGVFGSMILAKQKGDIKDAEESD